MPYAAAIADDEYASEALLHHAAEAALRLRQRLLRLGDLREVFPGEHEVIARERHVAATQPLAAIARRDRDQRTGLGPATAAQCLQTHPS